MLNRWYDSDATLSLMVSLIKDSNKDKREDCANLIIKLCNESNVNLSLNFFDGLQYGLKRWYDKEKKLFEAFEHLHIAPSDVRKKVVIEVIDFLQNDKASK